MAKHTERVSLEDFALKGMHLAKMTGVSLATHAIPDGFLLMHTGVGCKYKTAAQIANHDWGSHPNRREAWTQVAELQLIKGCSARIGPFARSWFERRRPEFMAVVSAYFIELTGEDFSDAVVAAEKTVPCDMAMVPTAAPNGGFFDGYASVMLEIAKKQDWKAPAEKPGAASAIGFFFTRYEPDDQADVTELGKLCDVAGVQLASTMFSGRPYAELREASKSEFVIQLPYAHPKQRKLRRLFRKRTTAKFDLPMGMAGTRRFVRQLTEMSGGDMERTEAWIETNERVVGEQVAKMSDHFRHVGAAIFADVPLAAGLYTILHDLGVHVRAVGLRDPFQSLGGKINFLETLERNGIRELDNVEIMLNPSLNTVRNRSMELVRAREMQVVIGSTHEMNVLQRQPAAVALSQPTILIEAGFPSDRQHATEPSPKLGYAGVAHWAQRLLSAAYAPRVGAPGMAT